MTPPVAGARAKAAPWVALAFVVGCVATMPRGAPLPGAVHAGLAALGVVAVLVARLDAAGRWASVCMWPIAACLAATGLSIAACGSPALSLERSASMVLFALLAIAGQVCLWDRRAAWCVAFAVAACVLAIALDVAWQKATGRSLWAGAPGTRRLSGSHGNANDMAVASLLLPIALACVPPGRASGWWRAMLFVAVVPTWLFSASRQAFGAWALACLAQIRARRSAIGWGAAVLVLVSVAISVTPVARSRVSALWERGLGVRQGIVAFGAELAWDHPFVGIGPGLFGEYYREAALDGWSFRGEALRPVGIPWVHCLPLEVACEYGLVGVAAFGTALLAALRSGFRGGRDADECDAPARIRRGASVVLAMVLLVGLVDLSFIKDWVRCLWWLALGLSLGGVSPEKAAASHSQP